MGKQSKKTVKVKAKEEQAALQQPPFDVTEEEYKVLTDQVNGLSIDEIKEEWILAARYGDLDVLHAILGSPKFQKEQKEKSTEEDIVHCQDAQNGNTALHMAAANGHTKVVELLILHPRIKAQHQVVNQSGNTALHWAAANARAETVAFLLQNVPDIDVLTKNKFGRSALTEGFNSDNTDVIKHILEHDSAAEEKLLEGGKEVDEDGNEIEEADDTAEGAGEETDNTNNDKKPKTVHKIKDIIHEFEFRILPPTGNSGDGDVVMDGTAPNLRIRELPIPASDPFGDSPELDTTGYGIWAASLVMARWMAAMSERFDGKRLLELGAGCGVPGMSAAYYSDATEVYVTDLNPTTLDNLNFNIQLNRQHTSSPSNTKWEDRLHAGPINWEDSETWPKDKIDYIIGSDLIYQESIVPFLQNVVLGLCQGQGTFLYVAPDTESDIGRDGLAEFIEAMKATEGCELVSAEVAPREYHANPLSNQDDDLCFLNFHELSSAAYRLYEFKIDIRKS